MILTVTLNPTVDKSYYIDKLIPGEVIRVNEKIQTAGGKGINVAKIAKLLDNAVIATGFLGGRSGGYIESFLKQASILTSFIYIDDETRTCVNINDNEFNNQTVLLEPGTFVNPVKQEEFIVHYADLLKGCKIVVLGGSIPLGIGYDFYPKLIKLAKDEGKPVVLDSSGETLRAGIRACPTIIKPNREELSAYLDRDINSIEEIVAAAKDIQNTGIDTVIVSLGKDGAVFVTKDGIYRGITPNVKIVNTVGCGDSLVAGFVTGLIKKEPIEETIKLAMAVSTANALSREIGSFVQTDLEDLLSKVTAVKQ